MCGITGIYNLVKDKKISRKVLANMTNSMAHRGPDDSGTIILKNAALGNRRLAILDLSKNGHMPMPDDKKELWITYNGEIYNYKEIREELIKKGYKFTSDSDTEVILYSYKEWGEKCLERFNDMFAFAIYDSRKNELFVARDRIGIKPLYYSTINGQFVFASEIKAILKHPNSKRNVNLEAVSSYLSYRYEIGEETLFDGIYKLLPGHYLTIKNNKIEIREYWDIDLSKNTTNEPEKHYKNVIRKLLEKSVQRRMISDVPVGAYLSGGLDSSIIVALMAKCSGKKVKTFSIGFKEEGFNEFYYSKLVAKMHNTEHREILLSMKDYLKNMKKLIRYKDLPLAVPNEVPIYLMSKELKKYITVVLSGEGADEIFSGYGRLFRSPLDYKKLKFINSLPSFLRKSLFKGFILKYKNKKFDSELEHFLHQYSYFPLQEKKLIFNDKMNEAIKNDEKLNKIFANHFYKARKRPYYEKIWYVFEKLHLPGLLQRLDCPTMAASVEGRVPYVDHELVEFMFTVPTKHKMKWKSPFHMIKSFNKTSDEISENNDTPKYILREACKDLLPREVLQRKKKGFPVPLDAWFKGKISTVAKRELLNKNSKIRMFINQKNLKEWIDANISNNEDENFGRKVWMLLNLEYWLREYF
ncbi:asparagine synthase (glutamine-hydrolyzing) [Candidatus Woesearchaeota archaeon]|nr:asparagine synthase (glutamine-hydrolyzing) [Candidatus Woesearchaeota archaeon]